MKSYLTSFERKCVKKVFKFLFLDPQILAEKMVHRVAPSLLYYTC